MLFRKQRIKTNVSSCFSIKRAHWLWFCAPVFLRAQSKNWAGRGKFFQPCSRYRRILVCLIKLVRRRMRFQHRVFPLSCWTREGFTRIQRAWRDSERLVLRAVPSKELLHEKINNKDVYVDYGSTKNIPQKIFHILCSLR